MPKITCLTISYNVEESLRRTIDSVMAQTFTDFEFIIADCGSTDGTQAIIKEYEQQDSRISAVYSDKNNILAHLTERMKNATGDWLTVSDAGDEYHPEFFQKALDFIKQRNIKPLGPQSVFEQSDVSISAECSISRDLIAEVCSKNSALAMLDKSIEHILSQSPFTTGLSARNAIFMSGAVCAILEGKYQGALEELIAMTEIEIPEDCAEAYLKLGQNLSAAVENAAAYVFFKKVLASYLIDNSRFDEANSELSELGEMLSGDEEVTQLWRKLISCDRTKAWRFPYIDAFVLIEKGERVNGFSELIRIYREKGSAEQESIMSMLMEEFHAPTREMLSDNYKKNQCALIEYPYWFGQSMPAFDELNMTVFPIDGNTCFMFNSKTNEFLEVEINSESETKYFFKDISKPIFVENETNEYNFRFLMDNVRPSEDVAMDNHIYLYYEDPELFYCVMQIMDLHMLLESNKAVFLIGEENRADYPIDFKARFNIDYSSMPKREIQVGDIKRLVLQWSIFGASGHSFLVEIMDYHPNLITHPDATLEFYSELRASASFGNPYDLIDNFFELPEDNTFRMEITKLICAVDRFEGEQKQAEIERYLSILRGMIPQVSLACASGWLKAILFAFSLYKGREFNDRIVPSFYHYPHCGRDAVLGQRAFYNSVCEDFPHYRILTTIRDPISVASSWVGCVQRKLPMSRLPSVWWISSQVFGFYTHFRSKHDYIYKNGVIIRFEDFKLNFPAMIQSIISFLNIPYSESLESTTQNGIVCKEIGSTRENYQNGFDTKPVYAHIMNHNYLSEYDKYRIEMIVSEYYSHFGYASKFYDGKVYTPEEAEKIMNEPWQCDQLEIEKGLFTKEQIADMRARTADYWRNSLKNPIPIGKDIVPMRILEPAEELLRAELYR